MKASARKTERSLLAGRSAPWSRQLPLVASIACAAALGVGAGEAREARTWLGAVASLWIGVVAARRTSRVGRALGWGMAMVLALLGPLGHHPVLEAFGSIGAMACAAAASVALARMPLAGVIVGSAPSSAVHAVFVIAAIWWAALVARLAPRDGPLAWMTGHPDLWALAAVAVSLLVLLAQAERTSSRRRLELGVIERTLAMRALLALSLATTLIVAVLGRAQADAVGRVVVALASGVVGGAALHPDAVRVARVTRRVLVLALAGGGIGLLGASVVAGGGSDAWSAMVVTSAVAVAIGAIAPSLEGPLRPARGALLDACARACAETSRGEPQDAIREVLVALRGAGGLSSASPELWTVTPSRLTTVDRAGYLHECDAELPDALIEVAGAEPEATLRADVLDALEVRRPELRSLSKWMDDRGALLATVIACDGEAEGVLVLPRVARDGPPNLEEVRAVREVAQRLGAACRSLGMQARMLARVEEANEKADRAEEQMERVSHEIALDMGRHALAAARLARPATVGGYSAGSRMALEALERRSALGAPIAIIAPSGVDPIPHLARAHLAGVRREAPLVLVDATSAREHDLARWRNPLASPLALADRGMLVLLDGAALPADVQQLVASALAEKRAPWERPEPIDIQLALTGVATPEELVAQARLDPSLALRLADAYQAAIALPRLRDRVDDLRAVITDRLAREGLRVLGRPVGIEQGAYARLIEHPFPGEDSELAVVVQRLVSRCHGDVVRVKDVDALRLRGQGLVRIRGSVGRKSPLSA